MSLREHKMYFQHKIVVIDADHCIIMIKGGNNQITIEGEYQAIRDKSINSIYRKEGEKEES